jgi:hypothetical protein
MAHFAKVENGLVVDVVVVNNENCGGGNFPESEEPGRIFIADLAKNDDRFWGEWYQTSYNTINGLHYQDNNIQYFFNSITNELETNGTTEGAFRLNFGYPGSTFDKNAGAYGEFYPPEEEI